MGDEKLYGDATRLPTIQEDRRRISIATDRYNSPLLSQDRDNLDSNGLRTVTNKCRGIRWIWWYYQATALARVCLWLWPGSKRRSVWKFSNWTDWWQRFFVCQERNPSKTQDLQVPPASQRGQHRGKVFVHRTRSRGHTSVVVRFSKGQGPSRICRIFRRKRIHCESTRTLCWESDFWDEYMASK